MFDPPIPKTHGPRSGNAQSQALAPLLREYKARLRRRGAVLWGRHYVWCAPYFDARRVPSYDPSNPPTSNPCEILQGLAEEVRRSDRHSTKIEQNKLGILRGAARHAEAGTISEAQREEIAEIVHTAAVSDFRPLLFVMPYSSVSRLVHKAGVKERAHPLSEEYIIAALPRKKFDIIDFHGI